MERPKITPWPAGKETVISLTFDDGMKSQLERAIPYMNKVGLRGSFYVNPRNDWREQLAPWREAAKAGHEIGNHTVSHLCSQSMGKVVGLETTTQEALEADIVEAERRLREAIPEQTVRSFCYPCYYHHVGAPTAATKGQTDPGRGRARRGRRDHDRGARRLAPGRTPAASRRLRRSGSAVRRRGAADGRNSQSCPARGARQGRPGGRPVPRTGHHPHHRSDLDLMASLEPLDDVINRSRRTRFPLAAGHACGGAIAMWSIDLPSFQAVQQPCRVLLSMPSVLSCWSATRGWPPRARSPGYAMR